MHSQGKILLNNLFQMSRHCEAWDKPWQSLLISKMRFPQSLRSFGMTIRFNTLILNYILFCLKSVKFYLTLTLQIHYNDETHTTSCINIFI